MGKSSTPYDDVFRTLLNDCSSLMIPVINEVFGEHYSGEEKLIFTPNEHFLNRQDGNEEERITDSSFTIAGRKYHWECQSRPDHSMLVRFFEYDTQIALDTGELKENVLTVTFPHSAVLFLRCAPSTPDQLKIRMITPGGSLTYDIHVMKSQQYTIEEIFQKNLLFLLPFYIFSHESRLKEYEQDTEKLELLKQEYAQIKDRLEELLRKKEIAEYTKCTMIDMTNKVVEHIAEKYDCVREGVKSVMGGRVLEYEAKTIRNEGMREGIKEGIRALIGSLRSFHISDEEIRKELIGRYHLTQKEAEAFLEEKSY